MALLLAFAFVGGALTILSPCTLPVIPFVLGSISGGRRSRTTGVVTGFGVTFMASAVLLAAALAALGIPTQPLRIGAALLLGLFGLTLAAPALTRWFERHTAGIGSRGAQIASAAGGDFIGGFVLGAAIGLVWAPCVGPIMAAVIATAVVAGPSGGAIVVSLAYVAGAGFATTAVALIGRSAIVALGGARVMAAIQRGFGLSMIAASLAVVAGVDLLIGRGLARVLPEDVARALIAVEERSGLEEELSLIRPDREVAESPAAAERSTPAHRSADLPVPLADALPANVALEDLGQAPEVRDITAWINSEPLSMAQLRGKVVLIHFWTFGCINCIHVQPYVKAWYEHYSGSGFIVLGVHTPELSFERDIENVRKAVADSSVRFPVAFDPSYGTWQAYGNHYWPAFYFVDRAGHIRHIHFGEGDYEGSEQVIRQLLAEPG
jgi:cytochrome c biogenesis protein CcdA/thiol-disulfide isomerase/thioredoxin